LARTVALFAVAALLITPAWLALADPAAPARQAFPMVGLALAATLFASRVRRARLRALALGALTIGAASSAFGIPLTNARPFDGEHDFVGPLLAAVRDGFRDFYEVRIPFDAVAHWQMSGLVLLAVFAFLAATGVLVAARRPVAAASALLVGVAWPATMVATWVPGARPLVTGAATLVAFLGFLFLLGRERVRGAAQAGAFAAVLVVVALAAATADAVAKPAFLQWEQWDFYDRPAPPVNVRYVWDANYDGISFPEKPTVVLRVRVPSTARSLYWRATTLDEYTGWVWRESLEGLGEPQSAETVDVTPLDSMLPREARDEDNWIRQEVTVEALEDNHLIGSAQPVRWEPGTSAPAQVAANGVVLLPDGLSRGQRYTVWSYVPPVRARALARVPADYPEAVSRYLEVLPGTEVPRFGAPGREARMRAIFDNPFGNLGAHAELYREARRVAGEAQSPYAAAAALETWLRGSGDFAYNEQPPSFETEAPLPTFVTDTKQGYCQHFAGAMALMLRLLGVPARVAAGFTSGEYSGDKGEWTVTDQNAHTWVEVYFPGHGWLPFDPTPGRGALSAPYSAAFPDYDPRAAAAALGFRSELVDLLENAQVGGRAAVGERERFAAEPGGGGGGAAAAGRNVVAPVLLIIALALAAIVAGKALYRAARLARRDPRAVATACRRDLVGFLADQRVQVPASTTLAELGDLIERTFGVEMQAFVGQVSAARFAPPASGQRAARRTRRELGRVRRALKRQLTLVSRVRGALSLRSLAA
jgi:transglutaminase-like putative cysteine protease